MKWVVVLTVLMFSCTDLDELRDPEAPDGQAPLPSETDTGYEDGSDDGGDDSSGGDDSNGEAVCEDQPKTCSQARGALGLLPGLPAGGLLDTIGGLLSGLSLLDILSPSNTEVCGYNDNEIVFENEDQPALLEQLTAGLLSDGWSPLGEAELDLCALLQLFTKDGDVLRLIADADGLVRLAL